MYPYGIENNIQYRSYNSIFGAAVRAELAYMEFDHDNSKNDELYDLGLTPVFRMQRDADLSSGMSPCAEAAIGPHLISETRLGSDQ